MQLKCALSLAALLHFYWSQNSVLGAQQQTVQGFLVYVCSEVSFWVSSQSPENPLSICKSLNAPRSSFTLYLYMLYVEFTYSYIFIYIWCVPEGSPSSIRVTKHVYRSHFILISFSFLSTGTEALCNIFLQLHFC